MTSKGEKGILTLYSDVQATSVRWLWYPFIAVGKITLLQGDPGDGKSTMMMNLIAELSKGGKLPDGKAVGLSQRVIYQCSEDGVSDTIKPRLEKCGADCGNSLVSMNMWGLTPDFLDVLEKGFKEFFEKEVPGNPQKAEYLIPIFIGELLEQGKMSVKVLKTNDTWYGMTYHEDVAAVKDSFKKMLENGVYKADLFSDL